MTQVGVQCVRGQITTAECKECRCNPLHPCMLPADVIQELDPDPTHRHSDPNIFSATGLLGCDRQHALRQEHAYYVDVDSAWNLLRGTMVHALMERSGTEYPQALLTLREMEFETLVDTAYGPQQFISQPDLIVVTSAIHLPTMSRSRTTRARGKWAMTS